jgi:outer membrane protein
LTRRSLYEWLYETGPTGRSLAWFDALRRRLAPELHVHAPRSAGRALAETGGNGWVMRTAIWLTLVVGFFPPAAWAQGALKIGVVDVRRVIAETEVGKQMREKFRSEITKVETELRQEKQELERMKTDLDKTEVLLRAEEKRELERRFQRRYRDYMQGMQDAQQELREREMELTREILGVVQDLVEEIGKKEGFTLIFEQSRTLYAGEAIDITKKIIELYDQRRAKPATAGS